MAQLKITGGVRINGLLAVAAALFDGVWENWFEDNWEDLMAENWEDII